MQLFNVPFCGPEFSTFGNVLIYKPKQAVIQSLCANLKSHEASLLIMKFRDDSRAYGNIKKIKQEVMNPFYYFRLNKQFAGKEKWVFNIC